jgi:hypothetical protein
VRLRDCAAGGVVQRRAKVALADIGGPGREPAAHSGNTVATSRNVKRDLSCQIGVPFEVVTMLGTPNCKKLNPPRNNSLTMKYAPHHSGPRIEFKVGFEFCRSLLRIGNVRPAVEESLRRLVHFYRKTYLRKSDEFVFVRKSKE